MVSKKTPLHEGFKKNKITDWRKSVFEVLELGRAWNLN